MKVRHRGRIDVWEPVPDPKKNNNDNDWIWWVLGGISLLFLLNSCS